MRRIDLKSECINLHADSFQKCYSEGELVLIHQAFALLQEHSGQKASAILDVVQLLLEQEVDAEVVISAILAPLLMDTTVSLDLVQEVFGSKIADILCPPRPSASGVVIAGEIHSGNNDYARCPSVLTIHRTALAIALLLIELEHMAVGETPRDRVKAEEALRTFVPLATRLNFRKVRLRLEDAAFRILEPDIYEKLRQQVAPMSAEDVRILEILRDGLRILLERNGIRGEVQGRIKSIYSLHLKILRTGRSVQSIMDRIGLRVVVSSVPECYAVLGILHSHFESIACCFDDYISSPKKNGYQSLHTCIFPVRNIHYKPVELQIRSVLMHQEAEFGAAAHSRYKEELQAGSADARNHDMQPAEEETVTTPPLEVDEFISRLSRLIYKENVVIFGQAGQIRYCPTAMTIGQYLQKARIEVSSKTLLLLNGKRSSLSDILHDADSLEIVLPDKAGRDAMLSKANHIESGRHYLYPL